MGKCTQCLTDSNVVKNGLNKYQKQNYLCKSCKKQFIDRSSFSAIVSTIQLLTLSKFF
ncbi:transposase-like zinc-binding domain-containing protein [Cardinium endosymbiont of Culicoides punctatus]|uniref:IS1/IS1595 family N-terminal zinc-binding domain-containing protein n=1 Tax=Cardinium endosymbiont of Culicoides punctatus TaxID=2304601 RepID=UPI003B967B43